MANPQGDKNYGRISNELAEALSRTNFSPYESRIFWAIFRKTYSWHKIQDFISLNQFVESTKLDRKSVCRTINSLIKRNIITVTKAINSGSPSIYKIQKDYERWEGYLSDKIEKNTKKEVVIYVEKPIDEAVEKAVDNLLIECGKVVGGSGSALCVTSGSGATHKR